MSSAAGPPMAFRQWSLFRACAGDGTAGDCQSCVHDTIRRVRSSEWLREPSSKWSRTGLLRKKPLDRVDRLLPLHSGDGLQQRDLLGTHLHAIPRLAAVGDAAFAHEDFQAFVLEGLADRVV